MKRIKKMVAVLAATPTIAMGVLGLNASASDVVPYGGTINRFFTVGAYNVEASVSLGYGGSGGNTYYGAATACNNINVTDRYVTLTGYTANSGNVYNSAYSYQGTASTSVYAPQGATFTNGTSSHSANSGTNTGSTVMTF